MNHSSERTSTGGFVGGSWAQAPSRRDASAMRLVRAGRRVESDVVTSKRRRGAPVVTNHGYNAQVGFAGQRGDGTSGCDST